MLGLRWTDVDSDNRTLRVAQTRQAVGGAPSFGEPKSATSRREVAYGATSENLLSRHRAAQAEARLKTGVDWQDTGLVFTRGKGQPLAGTTVSRRWKQFLKDHELPLIPLPRPSPRERELPTRRRAAGACRCRPAWACLHPPHPRHVRPHGIPSRYRGRAHREDPWRRLDSLVAELAYAADLQFGVTPLWPFIDLYFEPTQSALVR